MNRMSLFYVDVLWVLGCVGPHKEKLSLRLMITGMLITHARTHTHTVQVNLLRSEVNVICLFMPWTQEIGAWLLRPAGVSTQAAVC